jgi:hypothetical protein
MKIDIDDELLEKINKTLKCKGRNTINTQESWKEWIEYAMYAEIERYFDGYLDAN